MSVKTKEKRNNNSNLTNESVGSSRLSSGSGSSSSTSDGKKTKEKERTHKKWILFINMGTLSLTSMASDVAFGVAGLCRSSSFIRHRNFSILQFDAVCIRRESVYAFCISIFLYILLLLSVRLYGRTKCFGNLSIFGFAICTLVRSVHSFVRSLKAYTASMPLACVWCDAMALLCSLYICYARHWM